MVNGDGHGDGCGATERVSEEAGKGGEERGGEGGGGERRGRG